MICLVDPKERCRLPTLRVAHGKLRAGSAKYIRGLSTGPEMRAVRALHQKKYREEQGAFLVQGPKLVRELLSSGWPVRSVHVVAELASAFRHERQHVWPQHDLDRMGTLESGNQVIAVVERPPATEFVPLASHELVLAFDGIADPGNMGTLLRIADWFGVRRVLCSADCVEEFNPKCVQASMGSLFRVAVHRSELATTLGRLRGEGASLYLASMEGSDVFDTDLRRPAILVLGSESHGPSAAVRALGAKTIAIPQVGQAESLNVAMAASALCMEFFRQARTP